MIPNGPLSATVNRGRAGALFMGRDSPGGTNTQLNIGQFMMRKKLEYLPRGLELP